MSIRVAIIEDHVDFREGLYHVLQMSEGFRCVGKYGSLEEALPHLPSADVVLLDIGLPGMSGIEGVAIIKQKHPNAHIIMLTVFDDPKIIFQAILAGADGYILKSTPPTKVLEAIEDAAKGGIPLTPSVAAQALSLFKRYVPAPMEHHALSARETEILSLLVEGLDNEEIADKLFISIQTVRNHIRHIYAKLHVHSKSQAVAKAIKQGLI